MFSLSAHRTAQRDIQSLNGRKMLVMTNSNSHQFLDTANAAYYLGYSKSTLEWWRGEGIGPEYYKTGRRVRYKQSDLDAYIEAGRVQTRKEERVQTRPA